MQLLPPVGERRRLFGRNLRMVALVEAVILMAAMAGEEPLQALLCWSLLGLVVQWSRIVEDRERKRGEI